MTAASRNPPVDYPSRLGVVGLALFGSLCLSFCLQEILSSYTLSGTLMSRKLWTETVTLLGGKLSPVALDSELVDIPLGRLFATQLMITVVCWLGGAALLALKTGFRFSDVFWVWGRNGFRWWLLPGLWLLLWTVASIANWQSALSLLSSTPQLWLAVTIAGFAASFFALASSENSPIQSSDTEATQRIPTLVWAAVAIYVIVFTAMNWQLYRGLLLPHGDSAMYEEHLWNLEHGKGFRSYLDPGLFLGEHIQVIHIGLLPLHLAWPSQMLLELCESLALASGAIPVYWIARRQTGNQKAGALLACAYLLYFPMQFLDIAVDLKTFRPTAFGVPLLLFALDQMERRRFVTMAVLLLLTLCAKEDYSLVIAPLGLWLLCRGGKSSRAAGGAMMLLSVAYLLLVLLVLIPAFRAGGDPHYTGYFGWLHEAASDMEGGGWRVEDGGTGPVEIARVLLTRPSIWLGRLFSLQSFFSALLLLVPAAFLPLLSPGRIAVAVPLFCVLCLMEVSGGSPQETGLPLIPFHHFHAPLVGIIFWAAAAGLSHAPGFSTDVRGFVKTPAPATHVAGESDIAIPSMAWCRHFAWTSAVAGGFFLSLGPLGVPFWDAGSQWHWRSLYVPGPRAEEFPAVLAMIPETARVASTDLIHPRFTHYTRSYDYSAFPRAVNDNQPGAPPDADYIVIDKKSRYSKIEKPQDVREFREHPGDWNVLLDNEYFIVLQRKGQTTR